MIKNNISLISPMWPSEQTPYYGSFVKELCQGLHFEGWTIQKDAIIEGKPSSIFQKIIKHLRLAFNILKILFKKRNIIYVHSPHWFSLLIVIVKLYKKIPVVVNLHGGDVIHQKWTSKILWPFVKFLIKKADLIVVPSQYFAHEVIQATLISPEKIFISPSGGVDTALFYPTKPNIVLQKQIKISVEDIVLGFVGRLDSKKGWDTFIEVVWNLRQEGLKIFALFIGTGAQQSEFKSKIKEFKLEDSLHYIERLPHDELPNYFRLMNLFLFPTRLEESLGLTAIEALACGIPVIGSKIAVVPEYIHPGINGQLCEPNNANDFLIKVRQLLELSPTELNRMQKACVDTALLYDSKKIINQLSRRFELLG